MFVNVFVFFADIGGELVEKMPKEQEQGVSEDANELYGTRRRYIFR